MFLKLVGEIWKFVCEGCPALQRKGAPQPQKRERSGHKLYARVPSEALRRSRSGSGEGKLSLYFPSVTNSP